MVPLNLWGNFSVRPPSCAQYEAHYEPFQSPFRGLSLGPQPSLLYIIVCQLGMSKTGPLFAISMRAGWSVLTLFVFALCYLIFAICYFLNAICPLLSPIFHQPSAICHLLSAICYLPFARRERCRVCDLVCAPASARKMKASGNQSLRLLPRPDDICRSIAFSPRLIRLFPSPRTQFPIISSLLHL